MDKILKQAHKILVDAQKEPTTAKHLWFSLINLNHPIQTGLIGIYLEDITDYFGARVCRSRAPSYKLFPAICSNDYNIDQLGNFKYDRRPKDIKFCKINLKLAHQLPRNMFLYILNEGINSKELKQCAKDTDVRIVQPLLGITNYQPKSYHNATKVYNYHFKIDKYNEKLVNSITQREKLNNYVDKMGMAIGADVVRRIDNYCSIMLQSKNFKHVVAPKNLEPKYKKENLDFAD